MLYLIGLGLFDEQDISLRGIEALRRSGRVYVEQYTGFFHGEIERIEALCGMRVVVLSRLDLEEHPLDTVLKDAVKENVSLLVPGDPMVATTHADLVLRARRIGAKVQVIHASSVYSAVAETGLQIYKFGRTTSIVFPEGSYLPESPYDVLKDNFGRGLHTLCLLDIRADEQRYMTVVDAIGILLDISRRRKDDFFTDESFCVGVARLGGDVVIRAGRAIELLKFDFGLPPQVLIVPGKLHYMESEMLDIFRV